MKRPWMLPALAFAGGIVAAEFWRGPAAWLLPSFLVLSFLIARKLGREWVALAVGWAAAGWLAWWCDSTPLSDDDLRLQQLPPELAEIRGTVSEAPQLRLSAVGGRSTARTAVPVDLEAWRPAGESWSPIRGRIMTSTRGAAPAEIFPGQRVEISGLIQVVPGAPAPGLFDYRAYLRFRGISHRFAARSFHDWRIVSQPPIRRPWSAYFLPWAQQALSAGLPDDESTRLIWAMMLGWRTALTDEVAAPFVESGTMHVFAISGLHIALMSAVWVAVLRLARIQRQWCGLIVTPALWLYVAATGWQPSAVRSAVMMTIVVGGWALHRPGDVLNSLALAALVILALHPGELFQAGFQLSFAAVAGLALWAPRLAAGINRVLQVPADPFLPETSRPRWLAWSNKGLRALSHSLAVSLAALGATLPLTVHYFHLFSPIGLLANVVVVPVSSLALGASVGSLAAYVWSPPLAELFNASAWLWMNLTAELSRWFANVPGGVWAVARPPWAWWCFYYAFWLAPAVGAWDTPRRRRVWLIAGAALAAGSLAWSDWNARATRIAVLPGAVIVVDAPGRKQDAVFNAGGSFGASRLVLPWLRAQGWDRIPQLVVTQADAAHVGGATNLLDRLETDDIVVGPRRPRSPIFRSFLKDAESRAIPVRPVQAGDSIGDWKVLSPDPAAPAATAADLALALETRIGGWRMILLPGMTSTGFHRIEEDRNPNDPAADIVVAESSPREEPALSQLVAKLNPHLVIVTRPSRGLTATPRRDRPSPWMLIDVDQAGGVELAVRNNRLFLRRSDGSVEEIYHRAQPRP